MSPPDKDADARCPNEHTCGTAKLVPTAHCLCGSLSMEIMVREQAAICSVMIDMGRGQIVQLRNSVSHRPCRDDPAHDQLHHR